MRTNKVTVTYQDGDYEPTDDEMQEFISHMMRLLTEWKVELGDSEFMREQKRDYNKHAYMLRCFLANKLNDDWSFADYLADKYADDIHDFFREAHEQEIAMNLYLISGMKLDVVLI